MNRKTISLTVLCAFATLVTALSSCSKIADYLDPHYTLVFHSASEQEIEPLRISFFDLITYSLPEPKKEGYSFDGWYLDEELSIGYHINLLSEGENNLFAKYSINQYQITVHGETDKSFTFDYGEEINIAIDWGKGNYSTVYYYDKELTQIFDLNSMPAYDIDVYPKLEYKERYYSFVFNTGVEEQFDNIDYIEYKELSELLLPTPQKDGYEFDDWYLDEELSIKYDINKLNEGSNQLYAKFDETELARDCKEIVYSTNMLDMDSFTVRRAVTPSGKIEYISGGYTDFIPVKYQDSIVFGKGYSGNCYIRYVAAYDSKKRILPKKGCDGGTEQYLVPHGVCYVKLSLYRDNLANDSRINISNYLLPYEPYKKETAPIGERAKRRRAYDKKYRPFTTGLSEKTIEEASYKPLGELNKPYFCLISDDGLKEEATYSIPMAISKGVPMTLGLMKYSEIWKEPYLSILKDAVNNHGFEAAQHGWTRYTDYTEAQLNYFFDKEKEYFNNMGFNPKTAICPAHNISRLVSAVVSQRFEALRTGYLGEDDVCSYVYSRHLNGPKSNLFSLDCINISGEPFVDHKKRIDEACTNNWLLIGFYHENELDDAKKTKIEAIIDYAKEKGMEFCTLCEVAHLSER